MSYSKDVYIYSNELPQKLLSEEETQKLIIAAQNGDSRAKDKLVLYNTRLILSRLSKFYKQIVFDKGDLFSAGVIGLMNAINSFDVKKNIKFSTYATTCIENQMKKSIVEVTNELNIISLETPIRQEDGEDLKLEDILHDDNFFEDEIVNKDTNSILVKLIDELPEREREIVKMNFCFYGRKYSLREIGSIYGVTYNRIGMILHRALRMLKNKIKREKLMEEEYFSKSYK